MKDIQQLFRLTDASNIARPLVLMHEMIMLSVKKSLGQVELCCSIFHFEGGYKGRIEMGGWANKLQSILQRNPDAFENASEGLQSLQSVDVREWQPFPQSP